jgi:hypothetical protein
VHFPAEAVGAELIAHLEVPSRAVALRELNVARPSSVKPISISICSEDPAWLARLTRCRDNESPTDE